MRTYMVLLSIKEDEARPAQRNITLMQTVYSQGTTLPVSVQ